MATQLLASPAGPPDRSCSGRSPIGSVDAAGRPTGARPSFDRIFNLRDLGGRRGRGGRAVRTSVLYRSDGIHHASGADRERLAELGLRTVIDLRSANELTAGRAPDVVPDVAWHHRPVLASSWGEQGFGDADDPAAFLADRYREMLVEGRDAIVGVFALLASPSAYPCLFHCAAGKDRTGVVAALVLGVLGARDDEILDDYTASAGVVEATLATFDGEAPEVAKAIRATPSAHLAVAPRAMQALLDHVRDEHGSMVAYLRGIGVPFEAIESVHERLLA